MLIQTINENMNNRNARKNCRNMCATLFLKQMNIIPEKIANIRQTLQNMSWITFTVLRNKILPNFLLPIGFEGDQKIQEKIVSKYPKSGKNYMTSILKIKWKLMNWKARWKCYCWKIKSYQILLNPQQASFWKKWV